MTESEFKFERHNYETLPAAFYVTGYVIQWIKDSTIFAVFGPFKLAEHAHRYMVDLKFIDPSADLHLWQMLGINTEGEAPDGK